MKDREGSSYEDWGDPVAVTGEAWPASGEVQAKTYGERLAYIYNVRLDGAYTVEPDGSGRLHYVLADGTRIQEGDGITIFKSASGELTKPEYKIVSVRPYRFLKMEVERL
ncbi:MAG: hypothetical protein IJ899_20795 [Blautia sp.]|nr:hypothetical protein [Blautia sp.]